MFSKDSHTKGQKAVAGLHSALQPTNCTTNTVVMCSPSHLNALLGNFPAWSPSSHSGSHTPSSRCFNCWDWGPFTKSGSSDPWVPLLTPHTHTVWPNSQFPRAEAQISGSNIHSGQGRAHRVWPGVGGRAVGVLQVEVEGQQELCSITFTVGAATEHLQF